MNKEAGKKPVLHKKHVARLERERKQSRMILYVFIGILVTVVLLLVYGFLDIKYFQLLRPVAKIGDTEILVNQFEPRVRLQRQQLLAQYNQYSQYAQLFGMDMSKQLQQIESSLNAPETLGQSVLDQMVNEEIIRQESAKRGIVLTQAEMDEAMHTAFGYFPNGTPTASPTPTQLTMPTLPAEALAIVSLTPTAGATPNVTATPAVDGTLVASSTPTATLESTIVPTAGPTSTPEPTATPYTLEGFQSQFNDAKDRMMQFGFKEKDYRSLFEIQLLQEKLKDQITADVPHTEKQIWARHILVSDPTVAATVIERLKSGEDFATLAKELSEDTGSAPNGGDLGWFGTGAMVPEFETAAFALEKPGDYTTEPVKSQFGYHIIQLIAKQDRPLTQDQYDTARNKVFQDWLTAARKTYGVVTFDDVWKAHTPAEPNFVTMATDAANAQKTSVAKQKTTATP